MTLRYDAANIREWADFSGDQNPVHFEPSLAMRMGLANVPVHGMRVMLDLKAMLYRQLTSHITTQQEREQIEFRANLRAPVLRGTSYVLGAERRSASVNFKLADQSSSASCVTGHFRLARSKPPGDTRSPSQQRNLAQPFSISGKSFHDAFPAFQAMALDGAYLWLLIDSLLFRHVMKSGDWPFSHVSEELGFPEARTAGELMRHAIILQTHHMTSISPRAQELTLEDVSRSQSAEAFECEVEAPLSTGDSASGYLTQIVLNASYKGTWLVSTTIGLMILPPYPSAKTKGA